MFSMGRPTWTRIAQMHRLQRRNGGSPTLHRRLAVGREMAVSCDEFRSVCHLQLAGERDVCF
jgi:hypothetical protein